jgi:outer membrane protein OmpA-like peptidoglycan-associated protein
MAKALIDAARIAEQINIRGRTDAVVAGPADPRIALGRAMAAQKFLVNNGIGPDKITLSAQSDGDFVAPNLNQAARAMNRRVEVEIVHNRIAHLQGKAVQVAGH